MDNHTQKGFTLLEVLLAIVIFSVALSLFSLFFVNSFKQSKTQDQELVAMNLARQVAEEQKIVLDLNPSPVVINERTYQPKVTTYDLEPIKIIKVEIYSSDSRLLATLHTGVETD